MPKILSKQALDYRHDVGGRFLGSIYRCIYRCHPRISHRVRLLFAAQGPGGQPHRQPVGPAVHRAAPTARPAARAQQHPDPAAGRPGRAGQAASPVSAPAGGRQRATLLENNVQSVGAEGTPTLSPCALVAGTWRRTASTTSTPRPSSRSARWKTCEFSPQSKPIQTFSLVSTCHLYLLLLRGAMVSL